MHREQEEVRPERRDPAAQLTYLRKLNRIMAWCIVIAVATVLGGLSVIWKLSESNSLNTYLNCITIVASNINVPVCDPYRNHIREHTDADEKADRAIRAEEKKPE